LERVTAFAPGTASNLGPGFDCLGVALTGRGDLVTARRVSSPGLSVAYTSDPRIPQEPSRNTAAIAASAILRESGSSVGVELSVEKGLPLSGGMGGSAASAVAGALATDALLELGLERSKLFEAALAAEAVVAGRHADNIAPCLFGGAVLVFSLDPIRFAPIRVHPSLVFALVTPSYGVETAKARALLPSSVPRADAVRQAAHLGTLVLGLERGDPSLIRGCMFDLVAEPARAALYPGYVEARQAGLEAGAVGVSVSGAGPTLIALVVEGGEDQVIASITEAYRRLDIAATTHVSKVDSIGARLL